MKQQQHAGEAEEDGEAPSSSWHFSYSPLVVRQVLSFLRLLHWGLNRYD